MKIAQYKYDALLDKIDLLQTEIKGINELLSHYENVEREYETLLNAKRLWANENGYSIVENFESQIRNLENRKKELNEAINACKDLNLSLSSAKEDLSTAKNLRLFEMLGDGLVSSAVKNDHIKRATQYIKDSSEKAHFLIRELEDLKPYFNIETLEINEVSHIFDQFFDNFMSDLSNQNQIDNVYGIICKNLSNTEKLLLKLNDLNTDCTKRIEEITLKRNEIIRTL